MDERHQATGTGMTATRTDETLDQRMDRLGVLFEARLGEYFSRCGSVGVDNLHDGSCYSMGLDMKETPPNAASASARCCAC